VVRVVVGLGNPGPEYDGTRHNLGREAVRLLAAGLGCPRFTRGRWGLVARARLPHPGSGRPDDEVVLLLPETYMNLSGRAVRALLQEAAWELEDQDLLVVHDDLDLPLGRLRFRRGGSSGGHRGVESIIFELGTDRFVRLKIGIGRPPDGLDPVDYVLQRPPAEERECLDEALRRAAEAAETMLASGLEEAMTLFNRARGHPEPAGGSGRSEAASSPGGSQDSGSVEPDRPGTGRATAR